MRVCLCANEHLVRLRIDCVNDGLTGTPSSGASLASVTVRHGSVAPQVKPLDRVLKGSQAEDFKNARQVVGQHALFKVSGVCFVEQDAVGEPSTDLGTVTSQCELTQPSSEGAHQHTHGKESGRREDVATLDGFDTLRKLVLDTILTFDAVI